METFDKLIQEIGSRYCLGDKAGPFVQETLGLISGQPGGIDGFRNRLKDAGFAVEVGSWSGPEPVPLSGQEVEQALGGDVIREIANKVDVNQSFARTILGDVIPRIIILLAQGGAVPSAVPASAPSLPDSVIPLSSSPVEETTQHGGEQIRPSGADHFAAAPRQAPPHFERRFAYGSYAALAACLFGFAWAAGSYFSGGRSPFYPIKPPPAPTVASQESVERREMLRMAQKMAEDIQALKANVEALRAAQSQSGKDATALEGLKTRLDAVKTETGASIADLAGKVEQMQREPAAKLTQVIERLDRIEHQIAAPRATASLGAAATPGKTAARNQAQIAVAPAKPLPENAHGQRKIGGRGDAFDPSQNPAAPGVPRPLGSLESASTPQLITTWVVRDVYGGIALVESPRGSIEV
ncbi:MAG: YidB family protein, partial [Methylocella sp.]